MSMELLGAREPRPVLRRGRRRPLVPQAARGDRPDPPLDRHGRRLPALDLHPPRPHPRRPPGRLDGAARPVRRDRRLVGLRGRPRPLLAPPAAHLPVPVLLHRVRDRPARRLADLAAESLRPRRGRRRLPTRPGPRRLAAPARAVRGRRHPVRLRRRGHRPPDGHHRRGARPARALKPGGEDDPRWNAMWHRGSARQALTGPYWPKITVARTKVENRSGSSACPLRSGKPEILSVF